MSMQFFAGFLTGALAATLISAWAFAVVRRRIARTSSPAVIDRSSPEYYARLV